MGFERKEAPNTPPAPAHTRTVHTYNHPHPPNCSAFRKHRTARLSEVQRVLVVLAMARVVADGLHAERGARREHALTVRARRGAGLELGFVEHVVPSGRYKR